MKPATADLFGLTPAAFWRGGRLLLGGALGLGLLLVVYLTWAMPAAAPFVPVLLLAGAALWILVRYPLLNLCVVLVGFVAVADNEAGFQLQEVVYGLYVYSYLAGWFVLRWFIYRDRTALGAEDRALMLFLLLLPLTVPVSLFFGGDARGILSEMLALVLLSVYFPVREACVRHPQGVKALLIVVMVVTLGVAARNAFNYQQILSQATQAWQVATGRVATNDHIMMVGSVFWLALLVYARRWWSFGLLLGGFALVFVGLIVTQSRAYWMAFFLAAGLMLLLIDRQQRLRMLLLGLTGLTALTAIGLLFFSDYFDLLLAGLAKRIFSLQTAATSDISLVNRFYETATVWTYIIKNPVLGYGTGVPYYFFDITRQSTDIDAFVHNGYLGLWYKFGIWGLGLILFFWARNIWHGLLAFRDRAGDVWVRVGGLAAALCLIAFLLTTITSSPFFLKDSLFNIGLLSGVASGTYWRSRLDRRRREEAS